MYDTRTTLYHLEWEKNMIHFNIGLLTSQIWLFTISVVGYIWADPWCKNGHPWGQKLFFISFRGHLDLHHPVREKKVIHIDIGHLQFQIWPIFQFLGRAIHGLSPGANMADPWGPKLIFTFRGHMDLHHPARDKKVIYFYIGPITCQIWPMSQFFGTGHTWAGPWWPNGRPLGSKIYFYI